MSTLSSALRAAGLPGRLSTLLMVAVVGMSAQLTAQTGAPPPDFLVTTRSGQEFDATLTTLKKAIEGENLMVILEINPQQMLRLVGMRVGGMRQILFFHPRLMKQIIETNRNGGIEAPLKLLVMEAPDGAVRVRYHDPVHQFAPYEGLGEFATELRGILERVVDAVRG